MTNCKNCLIIRYFIIAVLVIILAALLFTDKMKYLSFINPEKISYLVIILGILVFLFKLFSYLKKNQRSLTSLTKLGIWPGNLPKVCPVKKLTDQ